MAENHVCSLYFLNSITLISAAVKITKLSQTITKIL